MFLLSGGDGAKTDICGAQALQLVFCFVSPRKEDTAGQDEDSR